MSTTIEKLKSQLIKNFDYEVEETDDDTLLVLDEEGVVFSVRQTGSFVRFLKYFALINRFVDDIEALTASLLSFTRHIPGTYFLINDKIAGVVEFPACDKTTVTNKQIETVADVFSHVEGPIDSVCKYASAGRKVSYREAGAIHTLLRAVKSGIESADDILESDEPEHVKDQLHAHFRDAIEIVNAWKAANARL